ncbi:MAG: sugar transferase, partial [Mycobacterium sp.]
MRAGVAPAAGWQGKYARWLALTDLVAVMMAVGIAQVVRFGSSSNIATAAMIPSISYTEISITIVIGWMAALTINGARSTRVIGSGVEEYRRVWWATISVFGTVAIISMLFKLEIARSYLLIALPVGVALLLMSRWV